jgi:hypothetical protein
MATKAPDFTNVIGSDAMQEYLDAQKNAREKFEERSNRLFDPTMLAMAQGFLAPTKTGSFGESLGNVAASVGPAQAAEEKRIMEMAKMRLEMAQQGVQTEMQTKQAEARQRAINEDLGGDSPYTKPPAIAPQPAPQPAPSAPAGALPTAQAPAAPAIQAPLSTAPQAAPQAAPMAQAPQAPSAPAGTQLFPAQPEGFTPQEKMDYKRGLAAGKDPYEIRKDIFENRRKNIQVNQAGTSGVNLATGQKFGFDPTPTKTYIHGYGSVEIPATYATMLGNAQDADDYAKIAKMIMFGPEPKTAAPSTPSGTPTGAAPAGAPTQRPTAEQAEAEAAGNKELAVGTAKTEVELRKEAPVEISMARDLSNSANSIYEKVSANPKGFGIFKKPGLLSAINTVVSQGIRANSRGVTVPAWEDAVRQADPKIKQTDIDAVQLVGADMANVELAYTRMFMSKQGQITEGERMISRAAGTGTVSNSPEVLKLRAQFVGKRADFDRDRLEGYKDYVGANPRGTYLQYTSTPEYKKLEKSYDSWVRSKAGAVSTKPRPTGKPDVSEARKNLDKELE